MKLPVIGLPTVPIEPSGRRPARYGINQAYVRALSRAGASPLLIPLLEDEAQLRAIYERLDAILFPGGEDVDPLAYGEQPLGNLNIVEPARDRVELRLARWAFDDNLPMLGICRGQQLLNVAYGGTLYQDLLVQKTTTVEHAQNDGRQRSDLVHRVRIDPDSRLAQLIDETEVEVNSLHHQAVKQPAPALQVIARSEDGVIEALESRERRFLLTVQWHPEEISHLDWVKRLFGGFVKAAARG